MEIELTGLSANARLQRALHDVAADVVCARVQLGFQQSLSVLKVKLGQFLEFASVQDWRPSNLRLLRRQTGLILSVSVFQGYFSEGSRYFSAGGFAGSSLASLLTLFLSL